MVTDSDNSVVGVVSMADVVRRGETKNGVTRETLQTVSHPTPEAGKPRAESAAKGKR